MDDILRVPMAAARLLVTMKELDRRVEKALKNSGFQMSCQRGCDGCCYMMTSILPLEGILLMQEIICRDGWQGVLLKCADHMRKVKGIYNRQHWVGLQIPCPLLENHECSVYSHRPGACRFHFARTPKENCAPGAPDLVEAPNLVEAENVVWELAILFSDGNPPFTGPISLMILDSARKYGFPEAQQLAHGLLAGLPSPERWTTECLQAMDWDKSDMQVLKTLLEK